MAKAIRTDAPTTDVKKYLLWAIYILAAVAFFVWLGNAASGLRPARLVQTTITGLLVGGVYALVAVGIVVIYKASGIFNFAHGHMMLFGAFVFYSFFTVANINTAAAAALAGITSLVAITMNNWRDVLNIRNLAYGLIATIIMTILMTIGGPELRILRATVGAVVASVLLGFIIERFTIRPLIGQPLFTVVLMTLALDRVLAGFTQLVWGSIDRPLTIFAGLQELGLPRVIRYDGRETFLDGLINIRPELVVAFVLAVTTFIVFVLFFRYTNVGLAMRATAENHQLAESVGLRVRMILAIAWGIATLLAMTAGVLQAGATSLGRSMPGLALAAFPAVLLGGLESIPGALVGGLVIGVVQEWANLLYPGTEAGTELAPYVVLMIVLVLRPDGLFGQERIERI